MAQAIYSWLRYALDDTALAVDKILRRAEYRETDWLELKAALIPTKEQKQKDRASKKEKVDESNDAYLWHVAKAVIAQANTKGGVVLLGVAEEDGPAQTGAGQVSERRAVIVGLENTNQGGDLLRRDRDKFVRENIIEKLLKKEVFKLQNEEVQLPSTGPMASVLIRCCPTESGHVVALLVPPLPALSWPIYVRYRVARRTVALVRSLGDVGNTIELEQGSAVTAYGRLRHRTERITALVGGSVLLAGVGALTIAKSALPSPTPPPPQAGPLLPAISIVVSAPSTVERGRPAAEPTASAAPASKVASAPTRRPRLPADASVDAGAPDAGRRTLSPAPDLKLR